MRYLSFSLLVILGLVCTSCSDNSPPVDDDPRVVATVDDKAISVSWFETTYVNFLIRSGGNDTEQNRFIHLENLIDAVLVSDYGIDRDLDADPEFLEYKNRQEKGAIGGRYFEEEFLNTLAPPTEEEIRETFVRWKDKVIVRHLFYTDPSLAAEAYDRLIQGRSFLEEAMQCYGLAEIDSSAGYLGPISYFNSDDAFADTAFQLDVGSFSPPVRSRYGYHIIRVDNRIREPLLTESEFQVRREGLSSQYRLRKRRMEGDQFVRDFMYARNVAVDAAAIQGLQSILRDFAVDVRPRTSIVESEGPGFQLDSFRKALNPGTVLATYVLDGRDYDFTAGDYEFWLPELPFQEALQRTAASVGRAMRNETLYLAAKAKGYHDTKAKAIVDRELIYQRSRMIRESMRDDTLATVDSRLIEETFARIGLGQSKAYLFDFVAVELDSRREAQDLANEVSSGMARLGAVPNSIVVSGEKADAFPNWEQAAKTVQIGVPTVVGLADGWGVIAVSKRDQIKLNWRDHEAEITSRLRPFAAEYNLVKSLRSGAEIVVDSTLFGQIMIGSM